MSLISSVYLWLKALHILAAIAWMAALLYLPRLFAYHAKTGGQKSPSHDVFCVMERRLLQIIATPAMLVVWFVGFGLALIPGVVDWSAFWPYFKLTAVAGLTWFHFWLAKCRREVAAGACVISERRFRQLNEIPTALVIVIVIAVVVKPF